MAQAPRVRPSTVITMSRESISRIVVTLFLCFLACMAGLESRPAASAARTAEVKTTAQNARIVGLRRLTEAQYRNSIAEIFGPGVSIVGRFEPMVRPAHQLMSTGARDATISPAGFEQFDQMARTIASQVLDKAHRATYMPCRPVDAAKPDPGCASRFLGPVGRYIFRRPLSDEELRSFSRMANIGAEQVRSFYSGLELALAAMLVSPHFLYIVEAAVPDAVNSDQWHLDSLSKASRLSFLLWNTTPNEELLAAAERGELDNAAVLSAVAARMAASPRFELGVRAFFSDMLMFEKFESLSKDPVIYKSFNQHIARDMPEQILRTIVDVVVTRNRDYREIFTTRRTFMTRALGPLYDLPVADTSGNWQAYEFPEDSGRQGILSLAGFLAVYSHPGRSSPTLRGVAIREALLCQPVPQPPPNVNFTVIQDTTNPTLRTARARLTAHTTDPVCSGCHDSMDPIGLTLEHFDGSGAYRELENATSLDVSGAFEGVDVIGADGLGRALATSTTAAQCVASRAYEYARGKPIQGNDTAVLNSIMSGFASNGYTISSLFRLVATAPQTYSVRAVADASPAEGNHNAVAKKTKASLSSPDGGKQ